MLTPHLGNTHRLLFEEDVQSPFFVWSRSADPIWIGHRVQSIVIHLGSGTSGHFQAYLRDSKQPPQGWWHCDDNRKPTWTPSLPAIAQERVVLLWLLPLTVVETIMTMSPQALALAAA